MEGFMPDFTKWENCIEDSNRYSVDYENNCGYRMKVEKIKINEIPQEVLFKLLKEEKEKKGE